MDERSDATVAELEQSPLLMAASRYPTGWACVSWSDELKVGDVRLKRYFGQDIVLWRGASGTAYAADAYCLHLGGNLGVGGCVEADDIVCPWHNWHWNGDGENTKIPYSAQERKPDVRLQTYPLKEWYGMLLLWHDVLGREALWEAPSIPEMDGGSMGPVSHDRRVVHRIRAHPQMAVENGADPFHVRVIHGGGETPEFEAYDFVDHVFSNKTMLTYGAGRESTWLTPNGPVRAGTDQYSWGLMLGLVRWPADLLASLQLSSFTPVDDEHMDYWFAMAVDRDVPNNTADRMVEHQMKVIVQDFFTWENMKVLRVPNLAPEEAKRLIPFRQWARQFYPEFEATVSIG